MQVVQSKYTPEPHCYRGWTGEAEQIVSLLAAEGYSATNIKMELRKYGYTFTRSAVCAKAKRLGIKLFGHLKQSEKFQVAMHALHAKRRGHAD